MKRLIIGAVAAGMLAAAVLALPSAKAGATAKPHLTLATLHLSKNWGLKSGQYVVVKGSGWDPSKKTVVLVECNLDAADNVTLNACDTGNVQAYVHVSASGTLQTSFRIDTGNINKASPLSQCPQSQAQASHAVTSALLALDYADNPITEFAIAPIWFAPPAPKVAFTKTGTTHTVTVTEKGSFVAGKVGGFGFWGTSATGGKGTQVCQGNSTGTTTWAVANLPLCKSTVGEIVKVTFAGKNHYIRTTTTNGTTGGYVFKVTKVKAGTYNMKVLGTTSGTQQLVKIKVP